MLQVAACEHSRLGGQFFDSVTGRMNIAEVKGHLHRLWWVRLATTIPERMRSLAYYFQDELTFEQKEELLNEALSIYVPSCAA